MKLHIVSQEFNLPYLFHIQMNSCLLVELYFGIIIHFRVWVISEPYSRRKLSITTERYEHKAFMRF